MRFTIVGLSVCMVPTVVVSSAFVTSQWNHQKQQHPRHPSNFLEKCVSPQHPATSALFSSTPLSPEIERLLQKAKELRAKAQQEEHQVHMSLAEKKAAEHAKTDQLIEHLFFHDAGGTLIDRLHEKKLCIDTLEKIVDRLDEREVIAEGKEHHVHLVLKDGIAGFERASTTRNESELAKLQGKVDELIQAVAILDEEFRQQQHEQGKTYTSHTENQHWGSDQRSERLTNRYHEIKREREEHFQKRLQDVYDSQKIDKNKPPPPKVKDDHGLVP